MVISCVIILLVNAYRRKKNTKKNTNRKSRVVVFSRRLQQDERAFHAGKQLTAATPHKTQWGRGFRSKWPAPKPVWLELSLLQRVEETWRYRHLLASIVVGGGVPSALCTLQMRAVCGECCL